MMSETRDVLVETSELANNLVRNNSEVRLLLASMITSRQLYAFCIHQMEFLFEKLIGLDEKQKTILREILISSAANAAANPFTESDLITSLETTIKDWVKTVSKEHTELEQKEKKERAGAREAERRALPVDLGFDAGPRESALVLIGKPEDVKEVMDSINRKVQKEVTQQSVRLRCDTQPVVTEYNHLELPAGFWQSQVVNRTAMKKFFTTDLIDRLSNPVDVLLVDDIYTEDKITSWQVQTNDKQKNLDSLAKSTGFKLVSGICLARELHPNELQLPEYESLRMFNTLRAVTRIDGELYIGQNKAELE